MKIISIFNNKGGVGKTTLTFHLAHILAEKGNKVLLIDLDPQCNLTAISMDKDKLREIWDEENPYIHDFRKMKNQDPDALKKISSETRSIHFLLKPIEDGESDGEISPPYKLTENLALIPGRLTVQKYENHISRLWSDFKSNVPFAVRAVEGIRELACKYAKRYDYDYVIIDTSPSLGSLNKVVISTADGFFIPCMPDMFSSYGIENIGRALGDWKKDFHLAYSNNNEKSNKTEKFVRLLGYTIYNAKKYTDVKHPWNLAQAHLNYAEKIPEIINEYMPESVCGHLTKDLIMKPIGDIAVMHTHNTFPNMAQKYHLPIWKIPEYKKLEAMDKSTITGNAEKYRHAKDGYSKFAEDLLIRLSTLDHI